MLQWDGRAWVATVPDAAGMRRLGAELAAVLRPGDLVLLDGPLGAGKTTLTQGIGAALAVRGAVTSPTFVIARRHPGPSTDLVHVDAYRLSGSVEVDDLDLDADPDHAVMVVEWGRGKVEGLSPDRLEVQIRRDQGSAGDPDDASGGLRTVALRGVGSRWVGLAFGPQ